MKQFIIFLVVVASLYAIYSSDAWRIGPWASGPTARDPSTITNPVYAEVRFGAQIHDRSFTMVALAKTFDQNDCKRMTDDLVGRMQSGQEVWQLISSDCKSMLDTRSARLFDNKPTFVNYVSASPGSSSEREERLLFWGVTAQEGELVCNEKTRLQNNWKGTVTCVRALSSE